MRSLLACPFCREMFSPEEAKRCPECDVGLVALAKLAPSEEAAALDPAPVEAVEPHMETLKFTYLERGRGLLTALAVLGLAAFFAPWVHESAPEIRVLSGYDLARMLGWMWAPAVAWFVMLPLVLSRRSIYRMRGARVAVAMLAAIVLVTVAVRVIFVPEPSPLRPVAFSWGWGLWATAGLAVAAAVAATRFGGRLDDVPTRKGRPKAETLH